MFISKFALDLRLAIPVYWKASVGSNSETCFPFLTGTCFSWSKVEFFQLIIVIYEVVRGVN